MEERIGFAYDIVFIKRIPGVLILIVMEERIGYHT